MKTIEAPFRATQEEIAAFRGGGEPVVVRGFAAGWPLVEAARDGRLSLIAQLKAMAAPFDISYAALPASEGGVLHYNKTVSRPNFARRTAKIPEFLDLCEAAAEDAQAETLAVQGVTAAEFFPPFGRDHPMPLAPAAAAARFWIGGKAIVAAHADPAENIAVVVAGRRRFTLFPPEQVENLYFGPFHITPGGPPVSMAHVTAPDFEKFPRFEKALEAATIVELEPGDILYIPYYWFHHVEALDPFNVLVNYWWDAARTDIGAPWDVLMHGMMTIRNLPADHRRAWRALFDYYVFLSADDPGAHLPPEARGILAATSPQDVARMRAALIAKLKEGGDRQG